MDFQKGIKFQSFVEFWEFLPENERLIVDVLRQIVLSNLPKSCKEKLSYNVPYFYGNRRICLIWPGAVPWGGIRSGVLFGFCQGNRLPDAENYLNHGTNKQVYYRIFHSVDEIDEEAIVRLLKEAVAVDLNFKQKK
ncbi:MAG: DUF1801 domain-containing protein [Prolixibacteraceae bacterium]|jgi:hypothetical protein